MPDVLNSRGQFAKEPTFAGPWATVTVPRGETSARRAAGRQPRPKLDPNRQRIKCAFCWSEAHDTRMDPEDGFVVHVCARCADLWDETYPNTQPARQPEPQAPEPLPDPETIRAQIRATDAQLRALAAQEPSPEQVARKAARRERIAQMHSTDGTHSLAEYPDRSRMHGPERRKLPSRSTEARRLEKQRERARKRGQEPDMTPTEVRAAEAAIKSIQRVARAIPIPIEPTHEEDGNQ